jgi:dolichol-phosphate mannosyltransferase
MRRVLLTGGTGFIGANLARRLLADGHEVHLLVRPQHDPWRVDEIRSDLRFHETPLDDADGVAAAVRAARPAWVFHLAAHGAYPFQQDAGEIVRTNLTGTIHLLDAALTAGVEAFVNTGSSSEYGFKDHAPAETEWLEPNSAYAVTKAAATHYCRHVARAKQAPVRTLRLYSIYGPWEEPSRLLPALVLAGLRGGLPPLVGPEVARDYLHVDDATEAYVRAAAAPDQEPGAVYNVGSGVQTTLAELVEIARRTLGIAAAPVWGTMAPRTWDTAVWVANREHIRAVLGWEPRIDVATGFARLVEWFRDRPAVQGLYRRRRGESTDA